MRSLKTLALTALLIGAMPMFAAAYMKIDAIKKGEATPASKDKHRDEIHIESFSWGASQTGGNHCSTGPFRFALRGADAESLKKLCQSRAPLGNVVIEADGVKHQFENASFTSCPGGEQFAINYTKCTFHNSAPIKTFLAPSDPRANAEPNARLTGWSTGPIPIRLESLKPNPDGKSATVVLRPMKGQAVTFTATIRPLAQMEFELTDGSTYTFDHPTVSNFLMADGSVRMSLNFTKVMFKQTPMSGERR